MFKSKPDYQAIERAVRPYRDLLEDLAAIYPVIESPAGSLSYYMGQPPLSAFYRVDEIRQAAQAARVANTKKESDALLKEFRSGSTKEAK